MPPVQPEPDFRVLFDAAPGAHLVVDADLAVVAVSEGYVRATRSTRDLVGRPLREALPADAELHASLQRVQVERRAETMPVRQYVVHPPCMAAALAERLCWRPVNTPVVDATGAVAYVIHTLEPVAHEATDPTAGRANDFLAMLGHELRNPLAAIASAAAILKRTGGASEAAAQSRAVIERQVRHLKRLVDDLLDAGRVQAGKITLARRPLDLAEAVEQALSVVRGTAASADHTLTLALEPVGVNADPTRLEQVITSLLTNAFKFTPPGRPIRIRVAPEGETAALCVEDEGVGIAADMLPRIFDLFFQGERSAARTEGGLGIGLTLVKTLTELHGGVVAAHSAGPGTGSTFVVRLPRVPIAERPGRTRPPVRDRVRRRVLIVEDNDDAREMLKTWLALEGHEVLEASNGVDGITLLVDARPEVAFIDIGLPVVDGYEVARTARRRGDHATRLVALTGYGQAEDRQRSYDAGFDDFVVKPVDPVRLTEILADRTGTFRW